MTRIDIRNFDETAATIDRIMTSNEFEEKQKQLEQCKQLSLNKYNLFNEIARACDKLDADGQKTDVLLKPASNFVSLHNLWLYTFGRNYYKLLSKIGNK